MSSFKHHPPPDLIRQFQDTPQLRLNRKISKQENIFAKPDLQPSKCEEMYVNKTDYYR